MKYIITTTDAVDTKLPNALYDVADKEDDFDNYDVADLYDDYEAEIVLGIYEAENETEAKGQAIKELEQNEYSSHNIDLLAYELK